MKLFDTLKNIWKIEELKTRILTTLGWIAGYVFGRCIFECFDLCLGNYALYLCFYRSSVTGNCGSLFSAYAA